MRFRCCPPAKAGAPAAAGAKKGGASLSRSAAGGARPGAKTGLKRDPKRNPLADVDCDDEVEEEIARAFAEGFNLTEGGTPGGSPPASPVSDPAAGPPRLCQEAPETLKARTLIILDWDDTLLTTTRLTSRHSVFGPGGTPAFRQDLAFCQSPANMAFHIRTTHARSGPRPSFCPTLSTDQLTAAWFTEVPLIATRRPA
jgi:hypothetical protein